jgi:hypothetical protein
MAQPQQGLRNRLLKGKLNSGNKFTGRGAKGLLLGKINFNVHGYLNILLFRRKIREKKIEAQILIQGIKLLECISKK